MAKLISLSFDDGRADTYTNAIPILRKYEIPATINVISDFIDHPDKYRMPCCHNGSMTVEELRECEKIGFELAAHGATHQNSAEDVVSCVSRMEQWGLNTASIGFASPYSYLTKINTSLIDELTNKCKLRYIRSGIQTRREGFLYAGLTLIMRKTRSRWLFWKLNKRCVLGSERGTFLLSVTVASTTTVEQLRYFVDRLQDNQAVIFNFHSILRPGEPGYGEGTWYWDSGRLDAFCKFLHQSRQLKAVRTIDLIGENIN